MFVNFGTYHHSTPRQSGELRDRVGGLFADLLLETFSRDSGLEILDAGCGLGFLSYIAAKTFPNADVTGIDTFDDESLPGSSKAKAEKNMGALGVGSRVRFLKQDLTASLTCGAEFDVVVSNLVFHNLGKKRFAGYENLFAALRENGYFLLGDLFPSEKSDNLSLNIYSTIEKEIGGDGSGKWKYKIKVLRKK